MGRPYHEVLRGSLFHDIDRSVVEDADDFWDRRVGVFGEKGLKFLMSAHGGEEAVFKSSSGANIPFISDMVALLSRDSDHLTIYSGLIDSDQWPSSLFTPTMTDEVQQEDLPILNTLKLDHWLIALGESLTACSTFCDGELHRQAVEVCPRQLLTLHSHCKCEQRTLKLAVEGRVMGYRLPTEGLLRDMWRSFRKRELGFLGDDKYDLAIALTGKLCAELVAADFL